MLLHELISSIYICFIKIITSLHALGRDFSNSKKVNKILCCLLESWVTKVIVIFESKDLSIYSIDQFLSSLIAYKQKIVYSKIDVSDKRKEKTT